MPKGRPTKLTPQVQEEICKALRKGHTYKIAAWAAGIHEGTFSHWFHDPDPSFDEFRQAVHDAEIEAQHAILELWRKAVPRDWHAGRDLLARRYPDEWGPREKIEHSGSQELTVKVVKYSDEGDK